MADTSLGAVMTPKTKHTNISIKYLDSKTKANSFMSWSNYNTNKSVNSSLDSTIKSLKNSFAGKMTGFSSGNKTIVPMNTQSTIKITSVTSTLPNRDLNDAFIPKYKETSASVRKAEELQTTEENTHRKPTVDKANKYTTRGVLKKAMLTNNANPNAVFLDPRGRRLSEIYPNNHNLKKGIADKITITSPKRVINASIELESPQAKKTDFLKSSLFDIDKRFASNCNSNRVSKSREKSVVAKTEEDDSNCRKFSLFNTKFNFLKANTELIFKKHLPVENEKLKSPKELKIELLSSRYDKCKNYSKPEKLDQLNILKKAKASAFLSKKNYNLQETHDKMNEINCKLNENKLGREGQKSVNHVIPNLTIEDMEKAATFVEKQHFSKGGMHDKSSKLEYKNEVEYFGKKQFVAKKAISKPEEFKSPQKKHFTGAKR